jgi:hypothetical protein
MSTQRQGQSAELRALHLYDHLLDEHAKTLANARLDRVDTVIEKLRADCSVDGCISQASWQRSSWRGEAFARRSCSNKKIEGMTIRRKVIPR